MDSVHVRMRLIPWGKRRARDDSEANVSPGDWSGLQDRLRLFVERVRRERLGLRQTIDGCRVVVDECFEETFLGEEWRELVAYRVEVLTDGSSFTLHEERRRTLADGSAR